MSMTDVIYIGIILALAILAFWLFMGWLSVREDLEIEERKHRMTWNAMDAARDEVKALREGVPESPTAQQLASICFSFRHDYGLMGPIEREKLRGAAAQWWRAIAKEINDPSQHPMVRDAALPQEDGE